MNLISHREMQNRIFLNKLFPHSKGKSRSEGWETSKFLYKYSAKLGVDYVISSAMSYHFVQNCWSGIELRSL